MLQFLYALQDIGLVVYSCLKAFLPLPSLEVLLVPLCAKYPSRYWIYALEGAIGTCIGGLIGYGIAYYYGYRLVQKFVSDEEMHKAQALIDQYGVIAIFIGGITPLPDFILAYIAGMTKMRILPFLFADGIARFLRSMIIGYCIFTMGRIIDFELYGNIFSIGVMVWLLGKYLLKKSLVSDKRLSNK